MEQVSRRGYLAATGTAVTGLSGCLGVSLGGSGGTVALGSLLPLSGPGALAEVAAHHERAVAAAVEHVNEAGGIDGREVEHVSLDTEASADAAADAWATLDSEDALGAVGPVISGISASLAGTAAEDGRPLVSPASTSPALADAGRAGGEKYFARTCPNDRQQAGVMAKVLEDSLYADADTVSVLYLDGEFGSALSTAIADATSADVAASVAFPGSPDDPETYVDRALGPDPGALAVVGTPGQGTSVIETALARDDAGEVVLSSGLLPPNPTPIYDGVYTASVADARTTGAARLDRELSDITPLRPYTTNAYDAAFLIALAADASDGTPAGVARSLRPVSRGEGHSVTVGEFDRARTLFDADRRVNYRGASGSVDLRPDLEPVSGYVVQRFTSASTETLELLHPSFFDTGGDGE
jgi:ABC-type branched-subunit amino acid transport system substrate-binding protein